MNSSAAVILREADIQKVGVLKGHVFVGPSFVAPEGVVAEVGNRNLGHQLATIKDKAFHMNMVMNLAKAPAVEEAFLNAGLKYDDGVDMGFGLHYPKGRTVTVRNGTKTIGVGTIQGEVTNDAGLSKAWIKMHAGDGITADILTPKQSLLLHERHGPI